MRASSEMQSAWSEYWKDGPTESLPEDRASGLLTALQSEWAAFFAGLPDGARLVDLATGGGDVVRQALAVGRDLAVTGVDIADLGAVAAAIPSPRVRFVGDTDLSSLPFADAAFDAVVSQFGFEYADPPLAVREALRVLAPGGRGRFILHRADSAITVGAANSLAAYQAVFPDNSGFRLGQSLFARRQAAEPAAAIADAVAQFRAAIAQAQARMRNERPYQIPANVIGFLTRLANAATQMPPEEALHQLGVVEHHNIARNLRKRAQIDSALDRQGVARLSGLLAGGGASVSAPAELKFSGGRILAWSLTFQK
jgi:SAM-dependent methyltransferase